MPEFDIGDVVIIVSGDESDYNPHLAIGTIGVITELSTRSNSNSGFYLGVCVYFEHPSDGYAPFNWWVNHSAISSATEVTLQDRVSNKIHKMFIRQPYYANYIGE